MTELLDAAGARGEPFAALWASEQAIYGRFGFGPAVPITRLELDRVHARFRIAGPVGDVELVDADEAAARFPSIYEAERRRRPVLFGRSAAWWQRELGDPADRRDGAGEKRYAVLGDRGYAIHRLRPAWRDGVPDGRVEVQELVAADPEATAALWGFVVDTDLSARTLAGRRPPDDPLLAMLEDPLRARPPADGPLYVRLVDAPAALVARRYLVDGALTIELHDRVRPANQGRWRLVVEDGVATCERTTAAPELELDAEAMATVSLGGVRVSTLAAAGRLTVHDAAAVGRADRLLATEVAPWHGFMF
jgi:predicted acetyltransferase